MCLNVLQAKDNHALHSKTAFFFQTTQRSGYEDSVYSIIIIIVQSLHIYNEIKNNKT